MEREARTSRSEFGTLLRSHRIAAGLSQEALAERARISTHGISALERGYRRTPQRETLALLAAALALTEEQRREFEAAAARPQVPKAPATVSLARDQRGKQMTSTTSFARFEIGPFQASISRPSRPFALVIPFALAAGLALVLIFGHSTKIPIGAPAQAVTALGPFQFDISNDLRSRVTVTAIGTPLADTIFPATNGARVEVACNEGTRYRSGGIRRVADTTSTPVPLRYKLLVDGRLENTYTVGTKFLIDVDNARLSQGFHTLRVDPVDTVPNSTMTFSCVAIADKN